jgi:general secretion pathway protein K
MGRYKPKSSVSASYAPRLYTSMAGQKGVALAIVVWFIAGMSLLVAGIVSHARVDTQMAQLHIAKAKAVAAGDGAIQLMLGERFLNQDRAADKQAPLSAVYQLGSAEVLVMLFPVSALLDLNKAPQAALGTLFIALAQVPDGEANTLAENVVNWRKANGTFRETEDLLRVGGMDRTIFESVRDFIAAKETLGTGADWEASLAAMSQRADQMNSGELNGLALRPEMLAGLNADGTTGGNESSLSGTYRADAMVRYGDQTWLRRRWVSVGSVAGSALPWKTLRSEPARVYE